jgi:NAD(P)H-hydrate repair Nnr-like enzyme with NAD(P)H-hydrate dehydratase domain
VRHLERPAVLTVNPTEIAHVLHVDEDEVDDDPVKATLELARRTAAVVLCGGSTKYVATPDGQCWRSSRGNPGLGTSGSGDVQAGIVAGLLARGATAEQAAVWGGWLHGRSGEVLAERLGPVGYLARELPGVVPGLLAERRPEGADR